MTDEKKLVAETKGTKEAPKPRTNRDVLMEDQVAHPVPFVAAHLPANIDDPLPVAEPKMPTDDEKKATAAKMELLKRIGDILAKYGNREADIPANSEYWGLVAQARMV